MRFVIVTGMSGAGKTAALKMLEDMKYFCVDNLPIQLLEKFTALMVEARGEDVQNAAIGIDVRSGEHLSDLDEVLSHMAESGCGYEILFLDAGDEVLTKRYKETRRSHPLSKDGRLIEGIRQEREALKSLRKQADYIIDTSRMLTRELRQELERIFVKDSKFGNMMVTVLSFGYKYGVPADADLVFDVRFLPNPYYVDELRAFTGADENVFRFVMDNEDAVRFADQLEQMMRFLLPLYAKEGKTSLVIGVGCTGGKHRSVSMAREIFRRISDCGGYGFRLEHRDLDKDRIEKGGHKI